MEWQITQDYLQGTTKNFIMTNKMAIFDLDNTLICTKSGKKFPINNKDWKFLYNNVKEILEKLVQLVPLYETKYCIIIISNQLKINNETFMEKINEIQKQLNLELKFLCSIKKNKYRKPMTGFFDKLIENINIDKRSFYCGDAAGREKDFSDCDYKFAKNCCINFKLPEEIFENKIIDIPKIIYPDTHHKNKKFTFTPQIKEIIIMIGYPASGKSYIANIINKKYNYEIIGNDSLSKKKYLEKINKCINDNKCFIIDNTNPTKDVRKIYIDIAKQNNYKIRAINMLSSYDLSMHRNYYRLLLQDYLIPELVYRIYKKKFQQPELIDGFDECINVEPLFVKDINYHKYLY